MHKQGRSARSSAGGDSFGSRKGTVNNHILNIKSALPLSACTPMAVLKHKKPRPRSSQKQQRWCYIGTTPLCVFLNLLCRAGPNPGRQELQQGFSFTTCNSHIGRVRLANLPDSLIPCVPTLAHKYWDDDMYIWKKIQRCVSTEP